MPESKDDLGLVLRAAQFAAHKHKDQRRKGVKATPYINHPINVAEVLHVARTGRASERARLVKLADLAQGTDHALTSLTIQYIVKR